MSAAQEKNDYGGRLTEAERYLTTLYGGVSDGYLNIWTAPNRHSHLFPAKRPKAAAYEAIKLGDHCNAYAFLAVLGDKPRRGSRGCEKDVSCLTCFWMDIDIKGAGHAREGQPPDMASVEKLLELCLLPVTMLVHSGNGVHAYWCFNEPWRFKSDDERHQAKELLNSFQRWFLVEAGKQGWKLDLTANLAHVLRVPGTSNFKRSSKPCFAHEADQLGDVRLVICEPKQRYDPRDFNWFPAVPLEKFNGIHRDDDNDREYETANWEQITKHCAWAASAEERSDELSEPEWHRLLTIAARCENGEAVAHQVSEPYPNYTHVETDDKVNHILNKGGPVRCSTVQAEGYGRGCCDGCPLNGHIASPIVLGTEHGLARALREAGIEEGNDWNDADIEQARAEWGSVWGERQPQLRDGRFKFLELWPGESTDVLAEGTENDWLCENFASLFTTGMVIGPSNCGKTSDELDLTMHVTCELPVWRGRKIKKFGAVAIVAGEFSNNYRKMIRGWLREHPDARMKHPLFILEHRIDIDKPKTFARFLHDLQGKAVEAYERCGSQLVRIVIDTFSKNNSGDPNQEKDVRPFIAHCDFMAAPLPNVVILHHTGWQGGRSRGSYSLPADTAEQWIFGDPVKVGDNQVSVTRWCDKMKGLDVEPVTILITKVAVTDETGEVVFTYPRVQQWDPAKQGEPPKAKEAGRPNKSSDPVLTLFQEAGDQGLLKSEAVGKLVKGGMNEGTARNTIDRLEEDGKLIKGEKEGKTFRYRVAASNHGTTQN